MWRFNMIKYKESSFYAFISKIFITLNIIGFLLYDYKKRAFDNVDD